MSAECCPVCLDPECVKSNDLFRGWPCSNAERLAIERAAELDAIKTALADPNAVWVNMLRGTIATPQAIRAGEEELGRHREELEQIKTAMGCQGMNLADTLKVVEALKESVIKESDIVDSYMDEFGNNVTVTRNPWQKSALAKKPAKA